MSSTEEKKLDDIHRIYEILNTNKNVDIQKVFLRAIRNDDFQNNKFKACLEKFICEYVSDNNLTDTMITKMTKPVSFIDNFLKQVEPLQIHIRRNGSPKGYISKTFNLTLSRFGFVSGNTLYELVKSVVTNLSCSPYVFGIKPESEISFDGYTYAYTSLGSGGPSKFPIKVVTVLIDTINDEEPVFIPNVDTFSL